MSDNILEMRDISKDFFGVYALKNVSLKVRKGEIHALCGENGAGKSTLMKILSGIYKHGSYSGEVFIRDKECHFKSTVDAEREGIAIIYQELNLVGEMDIAENIYLNSWPCKCGVVDSNAMFRKASELCTELGINANVHTKAKQLGIGMQQLVEIAKALAKDVDILVLDEPTASLTEKEVDVLMEFLDNLRRRGVTCIYISHKLEEMFRISDRISVLRDGQLVSTYDTSSVTENEIIRAMVGREIEDRFPYSPRELGETVLHVSNLDLTDDKGKNVLKNISLELRRGEVLGISGLMGAGRTELAMTIFGAMEGRRTGEVELFGLKAEIRSPADAIDRGIALVTEDRKAQGLLLTQTVSDNIVLASLKKLCRFDIVDTNLQYTYAQRYQQELGIKVPSIEAEVKSLSGGNQQKVVLAKWLMAEPKILILDEPTRGIDVGAKYEIYTIMMDLAARGFSIIMISSDLPEILGMSDRVAVMREGAIAGVLERGKATSESIMQMATGGKASGQ